MANHGERGETCLSSPLKLTETRDGMGEFLSYPMSFGNLTHKIPSSVGYLRIKPIIPYFGDESPSAEEYSSVGIIILELNIKSS